MFGHLQPRQIQQSGKWSIFEPDCRRESHRHLPGRCTGNNWSLCAAANIRLNPPATLPPSCVAVLYCTVAAEIHHRDLYTFFIFCFEAAQHDRSYQLRRQRDLVQCLNGKPKDKCVKLGGNASSCNGWSKHAPNVKCVSFEGSFTFSSG